MSDTTSDQEEVYPLSPEAVAAREKVRAMVTEMEEAERSRRVAEEQVKPDEQKEKAIDKLVKVQEDLIRFINLKKVKEAEEIERAQRITTDKKRDVHDELIRKAVQKEILKDEEKERARRIEESQDTSSDTQKERMKTYDRLVLVQEDLLRHMRKIQADTALKESQQEEIAHMNKAVVQEELLHQVKRQQANKAYKEEQDRQIEELEHLTPAEIEQRLSIASKLMEVQKQLLETHQPAKAIPEHHTDKMLEDFKIYMQEQLVRKANQKEAIEAMEGERKRRIAEGDSKSPTRKMSDQQAAVLEDITRKANTKQAKMLFEETQQQYILAEQKARAQEEAIRHINQKQVDKAMDEERQERVSSMEGKPSPKIDPSLKKDISQHASSK